MEISKPTENTHVARLAKYADTEYQAAHDEIFSHPLIPDIQPVLPPGVSSEDFRLALHEVAAAIGDDALFTGESLAQYVDPYEIPESQHDRKVPSAAVCPSSVEDLQAVLKIANKCKIPVWTFSQGKNFGYGGPAPVVSGSLALDLHRMNKILEVNEKLAYAVVEPGVTFQDLYKRCAADKLKIWPSGPSLGWGSVIGNALDRGQGYTPNGMHHEHIAGLEVVLANGDIVRTGQFAMSSSGSAHLTRLSFGPSIDGLFLQSNLGIVTKMGMHLTPQPQAYLAATFELPEFENIEVMVDVFGALHRDGTLPNTVFVGNVVGQLTGLGKRVDFWDREGAIPAWRLKELQEQFNMGYWNVKFGLYGREAIINAHYDEVQKILSEKMPTGRLRKEFYSGIDGALLEPTSVPGQRGGIYVGVPDIEILKFVNFHGGKDGSGIGAHGAYSPIVPLDGKAMLEWATAARKVSESHGFDLVFDFYAHHRHALCVCMLYFDKTNPTQRVATEQLWRDLLEIGSKLGLSNYRSHVAHMDMVADLFDFNDHAYRRFVEALKGTLDPNGILSPGKMGIWPPKQTVPS